MQVLLKFNIGDFRGFVVWGHCRFPNNRNLNQYLRTKIKTENVMRLSACLVFNPIMVDNDAASFNCTPVRRASDSMVAPT